MNAQSNNLARSLFVLAGLIVAIAVAPARGEGSIEFNGDDSPSSGTSKLENTSADVLDVSNMMTITVWAKAAARGEGSYGVLVQLPLANSPNDFVFSHGNGTNLYHIFADWGNGQAQWNYGANDLTWNCHQITYDLQSTDPPRIYVNGVLQTDSITTPASGSSPNPGVGYSVGNVSAGTNTWQGQIAQVQIHNRILSKTELDACRRDPGSVLNGLRLWLPMLNATDLNDHSGYEFHGTATDLMTGSDYPPAEYLFQFGVTNETRGQIVIPNSGLRGVRGVGPEATKLIAAAGVTGRFITTANFDTTWVDAATVSGLSLDGNKIATNTTVYAGHPMSGEWAQAEVADGVEIWAQHSRITNCRIRGFRGVGATIVRGGDSLQWGVFNQIDNCEIVQNFIGVYVTTSDQRVFQNMIANSRDAGIRIPSTAGNVQTANNHVFGAYRAYENLGGDGGKHVNDYYADAFRGIHLEGANETHFTNCMVQHCWEEAAFIGGARNSFTNCRFECAQSTIANTDATGVVLNQHADYTRFTGCQFGVNYWQNLEDESGYTAARAAIYFDIEPAGENPDYILEGVNISGTAYTWYQRTDDVLMRIVSTSDSVRSLTVDMDVEGFDETNDKLLVVDSDTYFRNCKLVFRGNFGGNLVPDDVFDLPTAWNGAMDDEEGNSITVYDTYDGDVHVLDMNGTY
jgi:hypothetical protein